jgi:H+-transporting ATPase
MSDRNKGQKQVESTDLAGANLKDVPLAQLQKRLEFVSEGLSRGQVEERLARYGYNELIEKKANPILKFLSYFWGPIPIMIIVAAALSGILRH